MFDKLFKKKVYAESFAETLLQEIVIKDIDELFKDDLPQWRTQESYNDSDFEYTLFNYLAGLVAVAMTWRAQHDDSFTKLIFHFRKLTLAEAKKRWNVAEDQFDDAIEVCADDFAQFMFHEPANDRGISFDWPMAWLKLFGVEETNPVILFRVGMTWKLQFDTVANSLNSVTIA